MGWGLFLAAAAVTAFLYPCFVVAGRCSRRERGKTGVDTSPDP